MEREKDILYEAKQSIQEHVGIIKEGTIGDNIRWKFTDNRELYVSGSGKLNAATSYMELHGGEIIEGENLFSEFEGIVKNTTESLFIGQDITEIGEFSFADFKNLRRVRVPYGLLNINMYAFYSCCNLKDIKLPDSIICRLQTFIPS